MIRYQIRALRKFLPKPVVSYSTSVSSAEKRQDIEEKKSAFIQQLLQEFHASERLILKLRERDAININFNVWKSHIDAMMKCGFSDVQCFKIISEYPSLLEIPMPKFESTLVQWFQANIWSEHVQAILTSQPELLEVDVDDIKTRIPHLFLYFNNSDRLSNLLISSPNVMFDHWESVLEKINYLLKEKKFKIGDLLQANIFSKSLNFIKLRLDLLEKCGIYKENKTPPHKVNKYDKSGHINPPLKDILHNSTKDFVKIAKISEEEYLVYEDIFMTEVYDKPGK